MDIRMLAFCIAVLASMSCREVIYPVSTGRADVTVAIQSDVAEHGAAIRHMVTLNGVAALLTISEDGTAILWRRCLVDALASYDFGGLRVQQLIRSRMGSRALVSVAGLFPATCFEVDAESGRIFSIAIGVFGISPAYLQNDDTMIAFSASGSIGLVDLDSGRTIQQESVGAYMPVGALSPAPEHDVFAVIVRPDGSNSAPSSLRLALFVSDLGQAVVQNAELPNTSLLLSMPCADTVLVYSDRCARLFQWTRRKDTLEWLRTWEGDVGIEGRVVSIASDSNFLWLAQMETLHVVDIHTKALVSSHSLRDAQLLSGRLRNGRISALHVLPHGGALVGCTDGTIRRIGSDGQPVMD